MDTKVYFSDIPATIFDVLRRAEHEILVAADEFTNREIFDCLCRQAALKVGVSIALADGETNRDSPGPNLQRLTDLGGQVVFIPPASRDEPLMHDNFCVIDKRTVITGSYNWSPEARTDNAYIIVITDAADIASRYRDLFNARMARARPGADPGADSQAVHQRLELIRNLILLGEYADIATHLGKLRPLAAAMKLEPILSACDARDFTPAREAIEAYLRRMTALAPAGRTETTLLKLQLSVIELRLDTLTNEKAELERRLMAFNRRYAEALGELIQRVLEARAKLAQDRVQTLREEEGAKARVEAEADAEEASERYEEYTRERRALFAEPPPRGLDEASERELKRLYRKACSLCHPDKVAAEHKARANEIFQELQEAYRRNDLQRVREIYAALKAGAPLAPHLALLNETNTLKATITQMESAIATLVRDLRALRDSEAVRLMESIDDFAAHVLRQRRALEAELERLEQQIRQYREPAK